MDVLEQQNDVVESVSPNEPIDDLTRSELNSFKGKWKWVLFNIVMAVIVALVVALGTVWGYQISHDKVFTVKDIDLETQYIPWETFGNYALYTDYLEPLFNKIGFYSTKVPGVDREKEQYYRYSDDTTFVDTQFGGYVEIPDSRYAVGFSYELYKPAAYDNNDYGRCSLEIYFGEADKYRSYSVENGESFRKSISIGTIYTYTVDFQQESDHLKNCTNTDIYEALQTFFDQPDIREKMLLDKLANG